MDKSHISFWGCLLYRADASLAGPRSTGSHLWMTDHGMKSALNHYKPAFTTKAPGEEHRRCCLYEPHFSPQPTVSHPHTSLQKSWRRGSPSLLTQHTANLIKSQMHNTLFKIQMFFTETSRRKGAEWNGPTKVIRIHLPGLIPITRSSLSALWVAGEHLETTSLACYTFIMPQMETP